MAAPLRSTPETARSRCPVLPGDLKSLRRSPRPDARTGRCPRWLQNSSRVRKAGHPTASTITNLAATAGIDNAWPARLHDVAHLEARFAQAAQDRPSLAEIPLGQHQDHADAEVEGSPVVGQVESAD